MTQLFFLQADNGAGAATQFCPNCGTKVTANDRFCPNCGFDLTPKVAPKAAAAAETPRPTPAPQPAAPQSASNPAAATPNSAQPPIAPATPTATRSQQAKPMSRQGKIKLGLGIGVAVVLLGGYFGLKTYYAPARQVSRLMTTVTSGSKASFAKAMATTDPGLKLNQATVGPFVTYLRADKERLANFTRTLQSGATSRYGVKLTTRGKQWLLFPKYVLAADTPTYVELTSRRKGVTLLQDGKRLGTTSASSKSLKAGPLLPGQYRFSATGQVAGTKTTAKLLVTVDSNGDQAPVAFDFNTVKLDVTSDLEGGQVTDTNGDKLGTIKDGTAKIGPVVYVKGLKFFVTKAFKSGTVTTQKYNPADEADTSANINAEVTLNSSGTLDEDTADNMVYNVLSGVQSLSSDSDSDLADYFTDTSNNAYKFFHDVGTSYAKRDDVSYSGFGGRAVKVSRTDADEWDVTFDMTYTVDYTDSEKDERVQTFTGDLTVKSAGKDDYGDPTYKITGMKTTTSKGQIVPAMTKVYDNNANTDADGPTGDSDRVY
ncbi:zinc ribbon domain-containing protein [Lacticaseibacillus suihuaensis]